MQFHLNGYHAGNPDIAIADEGWRDPSGELPQTVDVLIAGCGPAGLCLAAQLSRIASIRTMIVEPKLGPITKGQADGLNVRSMEMLQAFGYGEKLKREAVWVNETTFWTPDPANTSNIRRVGRVQDVAEGLSEMPHVLISQARVHDVYLEIMRNSPTRLQPDYGLEVVDVEVDDHPDFPVKATLRRTDPEREGKLEMIRAAYVVGCDGARSNVRKAIGGSLHGDAAHQAWGVIDLLAVTNFPDIRMKSLIQSENSGTVFVLPREGGYLFRLYVELDRLGEGERASDRGFGAEDTIAKANHILHPYSVEAKDVVWSSVYEIGHRLTDRFDDVPEAEVGTRNPRVILAGDACHTHSPKAGQGMNVSMGDTFNLGWKLIYVLTGRASPELLHSYTEERRGAAQALIDFDHKWSRIVGTKSEYEGEEGMPEFQRAFIANGEFTAGLSVCYEPSELIGSAKWQELAKGFPVGKRFHSAPVIRLADAKPMHIGHAFEADNRWRILAFAPQGDHGQTGGAIEKLSAFLERAPQSPVLRHTFAAEDIDAVIDFRAVFQQGFRTLEYAQMPSLLRPSKGRLGLHDYEKVFCADHAAGQDIFDMREIDRTAGCLIVIRPDQHVARVLPLDAVDELSAFFEAFLKPQER